MKAAWNRIHAWLAKNAPKGYGHLRPGAGVEAIKAAETALGLKLPTDYKASCRIHDGQASEPGLIGGEGWLLVPLSDVVKSWRKWFRDDPKYAHRVPIAWIGTGDYVFIDLDTDSEQRGGLMIQRKDSDDPDPFQPSFSAWLKDFADQLKTGEFAYSEADGEIVYADEIDFD